jgi:aerobic carbon-monoxide dehydrogenase medium subunit
MIPAPFDYEAADSVDQAIELLGSREDAKLLAGGHSLIPAMRLRLARPALLVDIGRIGELSYVREAGDQLAIGALTRHHDLERDPLLQEHCPVVSYAAGLIGDPQVRHRGTIGGAVAHADPAGDFPAVLTALDAEAIVRGPGGERTIRVADLVTGVFDTLLAPEDVVTEIRVRKLGEAGWSYVKFNRRAQDWATVGVTAVVGRSNGTISDAAIAFTNMGPKPVRATAAEHALRTPDDVEAAAEASLEGTDPPSDTNGSADYRRHLARVLVRRALEEAIHR